MDRGGKKIQKLDKPKPFISEDPQMMRRSRSVYLAVSHRSWLDSEKPYYPLYKVEEVDVDPSDDSGAAAPAPLSLSRVARLETNIKGKTFVPLLSRWIVGVGGIPGATVIFDTKTQAVIRGPKLVARKWCPVVVAIGCKVYALSKCPDYIEEPDFAPWFEVLDLSQATTAIGEEEKLDGFSWKPLPNPPCFPWKLPSSAYASPPCIHVRSHVVVGRYILISTTGEPRWRSTAGTCAFDTSSDEWHKVSNEGLPFVGRAIPHGDGDNHGIFLAFCWQKRSIQAYRIHAFTSISGGAPKLSVAVSVFPLENKQQEEEEVLGGAGAGGMENLFFTSLDRGRFSFLTYALDNRKSHMSYDEVMREFYPRKLSVNLRMYQMESPTLFEETPEKEGLHFAMKPEIAISTQQEQAFKIRSSSRGFIASSPIAFALSI